jgi:hypothetical protein
VWTLNLPHKTKISSTSWFSQTRPIYRGCFLQSMVLHTSIRKEFFGKPCTKRLHPSHVHSCALVILMKSCSKSIKRVGDLSHPSHQIVSVLWSTNKGSSTWVFRAIHTHGPTKDSILPISKKGLTEPFPTLSGEPPSPKLPFCISQPPHLIIILSFSTLMELFHQTQNPFALRLFGLEMAIAPKLSKKLGTVWFTALHYTSWSKSSRHPKKI